MKRRRIVAVPFLALIGSPSLTHAQVRPRTGRPATEQANRAFPRYRAIDLVGNPGSIAYAVNDLGQVAGTSPNSNRESRATLWAYGRRLDLGTLGGSSSEALGMNNRGHVVGRAATAEGSWAPFIWYKGEMQAIPASEGQASAINDRGQVAGFAYEGGSIRAFVYDGQKLVYLTDAGFYVDAFSINDRGQVVGSLATGAEHRAYVWEDGVFTLLPSLGGNDDAAYAINDLGDVVGRSFDGTTHHAVLWSGGKVIDLRVNALSDSDTYSYAYAINNRREIVGKTGVRVAGRRLRAFYSHDGKVTEMKSITAGETLGSNYAIAINNWGAVAGATVADDLPGAQPLLWVPFR